MKNKTIANWVIGALAACTLGAALESESSDLSALLFMVGGLGIWVFGIWAIVRLYKLEDIKK